MSTAAERANRTDDEWDELVAAATDILLEQGRKPDPRINYSTLNRMVAEQTGSEPFGLDTDHGRWAIGAMLAEVNNRTIADIEAVLGRKALLSVLVWLKDSGDLGNGFYDYARQLGLLKGRSADDRMVFLSEQMKTVAEYCRQIS